MTSAIPTDLLSARIINAAGTLTRLSGARIAPPVIAAMAEAAGQSFDMWKLQAAASRRIAKATGAEAGLVTTGAAAGLSLAAAAVMAGFNVNRMDSLPDTAQMPNEIIVPRTHRNAYDRALRVAGAKLIDVGVSDRQTGAGIRGLEAWEIEAAVGPRTVAIAASASEATLADIPLLAAVSRAHNLPLIVDAAAQLPPLENLRRPITMGASLVVYSGGKAVGGPQASGILAGDKSLIGSAALQMLDMDVRPEAFIPPPELFPDNRLQAVPRHGLGRGFKASKEAIVGLLIALDAFLDRDAEAEATVASRRASLIADALRHLNGVSTRQIIGRHETLPRLAITIDADAIGLTAREVASRLRKGQPAVFLAEGEIDANILTIDLIAVSADQDRPLVAALLAALHPPR